MKGYIYTIKLMREAERERAYAQIANYAHNAIYYNFIIIFTYLFKNISILHKLCAQNCYLCAFILLKTETL
jgi:hypothetical protein